MERMVLTFIGVAVFIVLCWALAIFYSKKTTNLDQYLVSGRAVGFWVLIGSWIGGLIGGSTLAGFLGYGWAWGMTRYFAILPACIFLLLFVVIFAKKLSILGSKYHLVSIPDFLALRFGDAVRVPAVLFVFFRMSFIVGLQIMALGLILKTGFGISLQAGMGIGALIMVGYVAIGGMMASIVVEWFQSLLQSIVLVACTLIGMWILSGGHIFKAYALAQETMAGTEGFSFNPLSLPVNMIINYFICMGFYYFADQWAFQRVFAASKPEVAFKCLSWGNVIGIFFVTLPFFTGIMLRSAAERGLVDIPLDMARDSVFFHFVINVLPTGVGVFFLVCYMAAVLSCGSAFLMSGAPLIVRDVYQSFINKNAEQKKLMFVGRVGVVIVAVVGIIAAFLIPDLVLLFNMGNVFTACGVLIPVLAAFFWKRATSRGGIMACWVGGVAGLTSCIWSLNNGGDYMLLPNGFPVILVGLISSLIALVVFSLTQKAESDEIVSVTLYSKMSATEEVIQKEAL
ncbi:MAG: sodium:solute symporter family protein [Clostridiales Family XIII bacterium]|nr:sodium:solute symporter family protein [Clostridiales Family XIII bacterium]